MKMENEEKVLSRVVVGRSIMQERKNAVSSIHVFPFHYIIRMAHQVRPSE